MAVQLYTLFLVVFLIRYHCNGENTTAATGCKDKIEEAKCIDFYNKNLCSQKYPAVLEKCPKTCNNCPTTQSVTTTARPPTTTTANISTTQAMVNITTSGPTSGVDDHNTQTTTVHTISSKAGKSFSSGASLPLILVLTRLVWNEISLVIGGW